MEELTQEGHVLSILEHNLGCPEELLVPSAHLKDDLGLSPLDLETLRILINRDCKIVLEKDDIAAIHTLEHLHDLVREKTAK